MICEGTRICFKAMCMSYDDKADEYHFNIFKIKTPFVIKNSKKTFERGKSVVFKANYLHTENAEHIFSLKDYDSKPIIINSSKINKKFLRESKILSLLYFWK